MDENSIKIDGTGYALITNIVIELLPNRDIFDNIFAESNDADDKADGSDTDSSEEDDDDPELEAVSDKICQLEYESKAALEAVRGAQSRLNILEAYGQSMASGNKYHPQTPFEDGMKIYRKQRAEIFGDHREGETKVENIQKEMLTLKKLEDRLRKRAAKHRAKVRVARGKEVEKQRRKDLEQVKERERVRKERELYWPKKVYVITVNIDVKATIDDDEGLIHDGIDMKTCDLTLSYATSHAFWSPTYDMSLSTTANSSGVLYFDARLTNQTSETWDKCSIALSTSQAEFSRLSELIPTLVPWNVSFTQKLISGTPGIMYSNDEMRGRGLPVKEQNTRFQRHELFGVERPMPSRTTQMSLAPSTSRNAQPEQQRPGLFGPARPAVWNQAPTGGLFGNQASTGGLFGNQAPTGGLFAPPTAGGGLFATTSTSLSGFGAFGQAQAQNTSGVQAQPPLDLEHTEPPEKAVSDTDDCPTPALLQPDLEFEESSFEEVGLTTTYALVGLKSLAPSSTTSRHRVARVTFSDVVFSHVVVPKHKRTVFLRPRCAIRASLLCRRARRDSPSTEVFLDELRCRVAVPGIPLPSASVSTLRSRFSIPSPRPSIPLVPYSSRRSKTTPCSPGPSRS